MKKVISAIVASFVMGIALPVLAADSAPVLNMNVRFMQTDGGTQAENRMMLHTVEISASQQVGNIGGSVLYRIADSSSVAGASVARSYPVEAKAFYQSGSYKFTMGEQFVPFGIYKWNNMYNPFLDIPGAMGLNWDSDWGYLFTYNAKPVLIDLGYWNNAGELQTYAGLMSNGMNRRETAEKNTITGRIGYDILSNLNIGASYMNGKVDMDSDTFALTTRKQWAIDTTWGIVPNLTAEAEYVNLSLKSAANLENLDEKANYGLVQLKYDIVKVPAPFNKISPVLQYSWLDPKGGTKVKNYQEELWVKAGKNLDVFFQNVQTKIAGTPDDKKYVLAVKYSFQ